MPACCASHRPGRQISEGWLALQNVHSYQAMSRPAKLGKSEETAANVQLLCLMNGGSTGSTQEKQHMFSGSFDQLNTIHVGLHKKGAENRRP